MVAPGESVKYGLGLTRGELLAPTAVVIDRISVEPPILQITQTHDAACVSYLERCFPVFELKAIGAGDAVIVASGSLGPGGRVEASRTVHLETLEVTSNSFAAAASRERQRRRTGVADAPWPTRMTRSTLASLLPPSPKKHSAPAVKRVPEIAAWSTPVSSELMEFAALYDRGALPAAFGEAASGWWSAFIVDRIDGSTVCGHSVPCSSAVRAESG